MKKSFYLLYLIVISIACWSCQKTGESVDKYEIALPDQVIDAFNAGKPPHERSEVSNGSINIRTSENNEVVIFFNWQPEKGDSKFYILQRKNTGKPEPVNMDIKNAQVYFFQRNLIVNAMDAKKTLLFGVEGYEGDSYLEHFKFTSSFTGYGMARYTAYFKNIIPTLPATPFKSIYLLLGNNQKYSDICDYAGSAGSTVACDAGGIGSGGCSLPQCSVSACASGYYSCCGDFWLDGTPPNSMTYQCKCCQTTH